MGKPTPSTTRFVVCRGERIPDETLERLAHLGHLDQGEEPLVIELSEEPESSRAGWERLREAVGTGVLIVPVLIGDGGRSLYPTGSIMVRFAETPSDAQLEAFARTHGLRVGHRNRYRSSQASFEISEPETTYVPELTDALTASQHVRLAWPETKTQYTRR